MGNLITNINVTGSNSDPKKNIAFSCAKLTSGTQPLTALPLLSTISKSTYHCEWWWGILFFTHILHNICSHCPSWSCLLITWITTGPGSFPRTRASCPRFTWLPATGPRTNSWCPICYDPIYYACIDTPNDDNRRVQEASDSCCSGKFFCSFFTLLQFLLIDTIYDL